MNKYLVCFLLLAVVFTPGCGETGKPVDGPGKTEKNVEQEESSLPEIEEITVSEYEFYFAEDISEALIDKIEGAESSIRLGMYRFCREGCSYLQPVLDALAEAHQRGVDVKVYVQRPDVPESGPTDFLVENGILVYKYQQPDFQYHRFMVIDSETVFFGSQKFTCQELTGMGYSLGLIARKPELALKIKKYLNHRASRAELIAPEREKWPLDIEERKLVERQQKITVSVRKTLKKITRSPDFETWWEYTTRQLQDSLLGTVIHYSEKSGGQQEIEEKIANLTAGDSTGNKDKARKMEDFLRSSCPEIYSKLRQKITGVQQKISENLDSIVLKEVDNGVVTEPVWFLGPRLIFKQSGKKWLLADIRWDGLSEKDDLDLPAFPGGMELFKETGISQIKEELEGNSVDESRYTGQINTTLSGLKIILSSWTGEHMGFRISRVDLESLPFPPGSGIKNNISLIVDRWEDSGGNIRKRQFNSFSDSFRKYSSNSTTMTSLAGPGGSPPDNLRALRGKVKMEFPTKIFRQKIPREAFPERSDFEWGEITDWGEDQIKLRIDPGYEKTLHYVSGRNNGEYTSIFAYQRSGYVQINSSRENIEQLQLFFGSDYEQWSEEFKLPFEIYEATYTIEELQKGVAPADISIKLTEMGKDDEGRSKLKFKFSDGQQRLLQWTPYSITKERLHPARTTTHYGEGITTHHVKKVPTRYKLRLGIVD